MYKFRRQILTTAAAIYAVGSWAPVWAQETDEPPYSVANTDERSSAIVVTAQKREQRLHDVPVPVTAISAESLVEGGLSRVEDYASSIPGVTLSASSGARATVVIRGLNAGGGNPTIGILVDDIPIGSSNFYGGLANTQIPNIDPGDLERVEILRGPQGTLYGASSLGGLFKFVTKDPSFSEAYGRASVGVSAIDGASDPGYNLLASVNIPLSEELAVQASGSWRHDPGYIDNIATGEKDLNDVRVAAVRFAALWRPTDNFNFKLGALHQEIEDGGAGTVTAGLGDLEQRKTKLYLRPNMSSTLVYGNASLDLDGAQLTSITGYTRTASTTLGNIGLGPWPMTYFGVNSALNRDDIITKKFSQELRGTFAVGKHVDVLLGAFYIDEKNRVDELWTAHDTATGVRAYEGSANGFEFDNLFEGTWLTSFKELALFADVTLKFSDRFDVQLGGRFSWNESGYSEIDGGGYGPILFGDPNPLITPETVVKDAPFTFLVTPSFKITDDLLLYARAASGYRVGGNNTTCTLLNIPCKYRPDTTYNYEIGLKGDIIEQFLAVDLSVYTIDWRNIQLSGGLYDDQGNFLAAVYENAGSARSRGVELALKSNPVEGLSLSGWVVRGDAKLTDELPSNALFVAEVGDPLPFSSKWSGGLSIDQEFYVSDDTTISVGATGTYIGQRFGNYPSDTTVARVVFPDYLKVDFRLGLEFGDWQANLFCSNCFNERGVVNQQRLDITIIKPRTVGLNVQRHF